MAEPAGAPRAESGPLEAVTLRAPKTRAGLGVLIAFIVAALVRWLPSLYPAYWADEVFTVAISGFTPPQILHLTAQDVHPPLYYYAVGLLMFIGRAMGGPFESLAWLRLASVIPGVVTCGGGWWVARRFWGDRAALATLWILALSPGLIFYSVELRNYALTHALLLGSTISFVFICSAGERRRPDLLLIYVLCTAGALYSHNVALVYVAAQGAILLIDLACRRGARRPLIIAAALAASGVGLLYLPWISILLRQNSHLTSASLEWLAPARARELFATLAFYFPFGVIEGVDPWRGAPFALSLSSILLFTCLTAAIFWNPAARRRLTSDRLSMTCFGMFVIPLLIAFTVSRFGWARIFMPTRYNFLALPFAVIFVAGMIRTLPFVRLRSGLWIAVAAVGGGAIVPNLAARFNQRDDIDCLAQLIEAESGIPGSRVAWIDPGLDPWLERNGDIRIESFESMRAAQVRPSGPVWMAGHLFLSGSMLTDPRTRLVNRLLEAEPGAGRIDSSLCWTWPDLWRLENEAFSRVMSAYEARLSSLKQSRFAIPGAQVLLPGDDPLRFGEGWAPADFDAQLNLSSWSIGDRQSIDWAGPEKPGEYRLVARFWRPHPFPEREQVIRYQLPGEREWRTADAPMNSVVIEGRVKIQKPGEPLTIRFEIPGWIPAERLPGSEDGRSVGLLFLGLDLQPVAVD